MERTWRHAPASSHHVRPPWRTQQQPDEKSKEVFLMPATTGMKGAGYYDQHSGTQLSTIETLGDWVDDAVASLPLPAAAQPVTVLDLGSSEGRNAVRLLAAVVAGLRRRTGQPLQTICSDLASNNFNQLFAKMVSSTFGRIRLAPDFPCRRRSPPRSSDRPSWTWSGSWKCRARELVPGGKLLLAGPGDTPIFNTLAPKQEEIARIKSLIVTLVPMGRFSTPEGVASAVLFLPADDSSFVTGIVLFVDGGIAQV
jgi:hypothetical protein